MSTDDSHSTDTSDAGRTGSGHRRPRRLLLMRHAKAEHEGATDHARRLSDRGRRDARTAGLVLRERDDVPRLVLVSTAQRTRETWEGVRAGLSGTTQEPEVWFDRALYDSGPRAVVELVGAVEDSVSSVLVIGHNPTISMVAAALSDGLADPSLERAAAEGLPTAALACFDVPVPWPDVNAGRLRLTHVDKPRG